MADANRLDKPCESENMYINPTPLCARESQVLQGFTLATATAPSPGGPAMPATRAPQASTLACAARCGADTLAKRPH